jgi:hypothetical protein
MNTSGGLQAARCFPGWTRVLYTSGIGRSTCWVPNSKVLAPGDALLGFSRLSGLKSEPQLKALVNPPPRLYNHLNEPTLKKEGYAQLAR